MSKRAVVRISVEDLHALLRLPPGVEILHAVASNFGLTLDLIITAPNMVDTDTAIGCTPPSAHVNLVQEDGVTYVASLAYPSERRD